MLQCQLCSHRLNRVSLAVGATLLLGLFCQAFCFAPRLIAAALRGIFQGVSWLLRRIYSRLRFAAGYVGKLGRRRTTFNFGNRTRMGDLEMNGPSPTFKFAKVLELQKRSGGGLLIPYLHFADVFSISMVKALRPTLSTQTQGFDRELLRKETCINGSKTDCWGCGNQICQVRFEFPARPFHPNTPTRTAQPSATLRIPKPPSTSRTASQSVHPATTSTAAGHPSRTSRRRARPADMFKRPKSLRAVRESYARSAVIGKQTRSNCQDNERRPAS